MLGIGVSEFERAFLSWKAGVRARVKLAWVVCPTCTRVITDYASNVYEWSQFVCPECFELFATPEPVAPNFLAGLHLEFKDGALRYRHLCYKMEAQAVHPSKSTNVFAHSNDRVFHF